MTRHSRQAILPEVGAAGQARLAQAHILVVGAGGLGVPALQYLAGAGIGHITLIDPDQVETSNLHRQPIYGPYVGQPKAVAAQAFVAALDPSITLTPNVALFDPENGPDLVASVDLVLDCADSFAASYLASDLCLAAGKPLISASALGLSGYVGGFCGTAPSLRAVFPDLPQSLATCATAGVLGPVVGMFGALQAQMALAVLLGITPSPLGQLLRYDMSGFRFAGFRFDGAEEPSTRHHSFLAKQAISPQDFVVELRDLNEVTSPVTPWASRHRVEDFAQNDVPKPAPGQRVVFACRSGLRAWRAADLLRPMIDNQIYLVADPR